MSNPTFEILNPGLFTTVQDRGRYGFQHLGVPVSGAMDEPALRAANILVGNEEDAACLEITVVGPTVRFITSTTIAITGGDLSPMLDGNPLERWQTIKVMAGAKLTFGDLRYGMRAYLAIAGGIDVPIVMNSRSTYVPGSFGGLKGRPLLTGDVLSVFGNNQSTVYSSKDILQYDQDHQIRVVLGPNQSFFSEDTIEEFLSASFQISLDSDRMGYKLDGPHISNSGAYNIISEGNPAGAIQISGDGVPTILLSDRGTTGGYPKIATVIRADIPILAQSLPGETVTFSKTTVEEANDAMNKTEEHLSRITRIKPIIVLIDGNPVESEDENGNPLSIIPEVTTSSNVDTELVTTKVNDDEFEFRVEVQKSE